jgi:hypothetical protein
VADPQISLVRAGASVLSSLLRVRRPEHRRVGATPPSHDLLGGVLGALDEQGANALQGCDETLEEYLAAVAAIHPSRLGRHDALAFWINTYNAGALRLAARAERAGDDSVLRQPGAFTTPYLTVEGERLSLDAVEHAKVRRFRDPRIHAALVCGSISCPTLRNEPFVGDRLDEQLEEQMRSFLATGGVVWDGERLVLSKVFQWYSGDLAHPDRMPWLLPASARTVARGLRPWLGDDLAAHLDDPGIEVAFAPYDWGLRCALG